MNDYPVRANTELSCMRINAAGDGRESDLITPIMYLATTSSKVLTRKTHRASRIYMGSFGRVRRNQFNFDAVPLALAASFNELGPHLTKDTVSHDGRLQIRDYHGGCHLRPPCADGTAGFTLQRPSKQVRKQRPTRSCPLGEDSRAWLADFCSQNGFGRTLRGPHVCSALCQTVLIPTVCQASERWHSDTARDVPN